MTENIENLIKAKEELKSLKESIVNTDISPLTKEEKGKIEEDRKILGIYYQDNLYSFEDAKKIAEETKVNIK